MKNLDGLTAFVNHLTPKTLIIVIVGLLISTCTMLVFSAFVTKSVEDGKTNKKNEENES